MLSHGSPATASKGQYSRPAVQSGAPGVNLGGVRPLTWKAESKRLFEATKASGPDVQDPTVLYGQLTLAVLGSVRGWDERFPLPGRRIR